MSTGTNLIAIEFDVFPVAILTDEQKAAVHAAALAKPTPEKFVSADANSSFEVQRVESANVVPIALGPHSDEI